MTNDHTLSRELVNRTVPDRRILALNELVGDRACKLRLPRSVPCSLNCPVANAQTGESRVVSSDGGCMPVRRARGIWIWAGVEQAEQMRDFRTAARDLRPFSGSCASYTLRSCRPSQIPWSAIWSARGLRLSRCPGLLHSSPTSLRRTHSLTTSSTVRRLSCSAAYAIARAPHVRPGGFPMNCLSGATGSTSSDSPN